MLARILSLPFFVILLGIAAISMYVPAAHAAIVENFKVMRAFFQSGNMMLILTSFVALATAGNRPGHRGRNHLLAMLATFAGLPLALAVPFRIAVPDTTFLNAYFEMVSSITTTGATLFEDPARLPPSVHLWRGLVGWLGGDDLPNARKQGEGHRRIIQKHFTGTTEEGQPEAGGTADRFGAGSAEIACAGAIATLGPR